MTPQLPMLLAATAAGLAAQRLPASGRVRERFWVAYYWTVTPLLVLATFATVRLAHGLVLALAAAVIGSWLTGAAAYAYASVVGRTREERGALALGGGCGNTGFVGMPLAQLAFGHPGLALAVLYDRLAWLVPATSVAVAFARLHGRRPAAETQRGSLRSVLLNPPLWAAAAAVSLRLAGLHLPHAAALQGAAGDVVGPAGFFLLGLALPLERVAHGSDEVARATGAILVRLAGGPLALLLAGRVLHADVPGAFYLLAAMPSAFHLLVLARVYDVRPALMRLLVVGSTVPAVVAVAVGAVLAR